MDIARIKGYCYTIASSRNEFIKRKQQGELPVSKDGLVKFSRFIYDSRNKELAVPRILDSDAPQARPSSVVRSVVRRPPSRSHCPPPAACMCV
jgi:hypothetical protein